MVVSSEEMLDLEAERRGLFNLAMRYMHNTSEAEELADAAIAKALMNRGRFEVRNEKAWLRGILINECLHRKRDVKSEERHRFRLPYPKTPLQLAIDRELQDIVDDAVMDLTPDQWWALYHFQFQDLSSKETAEKMAKKSGSVRALVHRLRRKLAPRLVEFVKP